MGKWVATLDTARKLGARVVCTGHGPRSAGTILDDQQAFFKALIEQVGKVMAHRSPDEARVHIEPIRTSLRGNPQIARYVGETGAGWDPFPSQVGKVYEELTGNKLASLTHKPPQARLPMPGRTVWPLPEGGLRSP